MPLLGEKLIALFAVKTIRDCGFFSQRTYQGLCGGGQKAGRAGLVSLGGLGVFPGANWLQGITGFP
ncbi:hypothetical protein EEB15_03150 [Ramlibacter sp. WS9]|nr:hypothetical protein EEB15_03150 [Ramlibacter sp. WS9]